MSAGQGPPKGKPWVWLSLELVESDAWRSMGINSFRFVTFLWREHMRHGGAENGKLKAPQHQLVSYGIGARYIKDAIAQADDLGLVDCQRNGERIMSTYALTWLPTCDRREPSNRWQAYRNPSLNPLPVPKSRNLPLKGKAGLPLKGKADGVNLPLKGKADSPENLPLKGKALSISSFRGRSISKDLSGDEAAASRVSGQADDASDHVAGDGHDLDGDDVVAR